MNRAERTGAPALGNAVGYFTILYLTPQVTWLGPDNEAVAVAMAGTIFIHFFNEIRALAAWVKSRYNVK